MNSKKVNWMYLTSVLIQIAVVAGLTLYVYNIGPVNLPIWLNLLLSQGMILIPTLLFLAFSREKWNDILGFHKIKISSALMIILFTYLMMPITTVINAISLLFVDNAVAGMSGSITQMPIAATALMMGFIGPVSEEVVCRGFVLNGYKRSGNTFRAILFSALLFGLMHMNFNQAAYAVFLGIVMAVLVEATGSIWSSILFHVTTNLNSVVLMYISRNMVGDTYMEGAQELVDETEMLFATIGIYSVIAMVTTAIAVCVLIWVAKNEKKELHLQEIWRSRKENKGQMVSIPLLLGIVLSIAYMVLDVILS